MPVRARGHQDSGGAAAGGWGRGRLLAVLAGVGLAALVGVGGIAEAVHLALAGTDQGDGIGSGFSVGPSAGPGEGGGAAWRDRVAAAPMLRVPATAAWPAQTTPARSGAPIVVPPGTGVVGPAYVMTGFPHTPQGAIAQLAQIDIAALTSLSTATAGEVHRAWVMPDGVGEQGWWPLVSMRAFLDSIGAAPSGGSAAVPSLSLMPVAALVKGTDGNDWAVVCVLFEVTGSFRSQAQIAAGDCARMQWDRGRWMIGPGPAPAPAPATWPGTGWAARAGWRTWSASPAGSPSQP